MCASCAYLQADYDLPSSASLGAGRKVHENTSIFELDECVIPAFLVVGGGPSLVVVGP